MKNLRMSRKIMFIKPKMAASKPNEKNWGYIRWKLPLMIKVYSKLFSFHEVSYNVTETDFYKNQDGRQDGGHMKPRYIIWS